MSVKKRVGEVIVSPSNTTVLFKVWFQIHSYCAAFCIGFIMNVRGGEVEYEAIILVTRGDEMPKKNYEKKLHPTYEVN